MRVNDRPVLWHIAVSHFSEKARWALDYKGIAHTRRAPLPGLHMPLVYWMTRGRSITLPLLELDGERIADSTAIIAALERRFPEPALYPSDPQELRRALELEEWFDEQLAPYIRRLAFFELRHEPELMAEMAARIAPALASTAGATLVPYTRLFTGLRYRASDAQGAEHARGMVLAALDRLEAELGGNDYLVGGRFTVADLTAAALLYPLALPPQGPQILVRMPDSYERFSAPLRERPACTWVQEMFTRHRLPAGTDAQAQSNPAGYMAAAAP
ncbi:MAG TPA: glutathione S-transferase family protein [Solirubrobacteraceae bacterium]|nr:glutathione S-transferase family protein [Solirubrobacteraceae bacterium]